MKNGLILGLCALAIFAACQQQPVACTMDAKQCPDGSFVGRVGPDCEFAKCPTMEQDYETEFLCPRDVKECPDGSYVGRVGPHCEFEQCPELERVECRPDQRNVDACIEIYQPVCGWFNQNIQCIRYPCAETYSNSCFACDNPDVAYYTMGECPS